MLFFDEFDSIALSRAHMEKIVGLGRLVVPVRPKSFHLLVALMCGFIGRALVPFDAETHEILKRGAWPYPLRVLAWLGVCVCV